jgi:ATP-dependent Lon protease
LIAARPQARVALGRVRRQKIRHYISESRRHSVIANLEARLVETEDKYWATISAINESFVNIPESIVRQYPMLLSGGMGGTIELTYDETEVHGKKIRPFKVTEFIPFQVSVINLQEYVDKRREFDSDEWIDVLVNSCGLNPASMTRRQKLLYLCRCIPLVEANCNMVELAPRETGKTYLYHNISYYAHVLSGGKATPAQLFVNLNTGKIGEVGTRDAVVFDEIASTDLTDPKAFVSIMQDAKFSRGIPLAVESYSRFGSSAGSGTAGRSAPGAASAARSLHATGVSISMPRRWASSL